MSIPPNEDRNSTRLSNSPSIPTSSPYPNTLNTQSIILFPKQISHHNGKKENSKQTSQHPPVREKMFIYEDIPRTLPVCIQACKAFTGLLGNPFRTLGNLLRMLLEEIRGRGDSIETRRIDSWAAGRPFSEGGFSP